jgi:hypothetical protein
LVDIATEIILIPLPKKKLNKTYPPKHPSEFYISPHTKINEYYECRENIAARAVAKLERQENLYLTRQTRF